MQKTKGIKRQYKECEFDFPSKIKAFIYHRDHDNVVHLSCLLQPWQKWRTVVHIGNGFMEWRWFKTKQEAVKWVNKFK